LQRDVIWSEKVRCISKIKPRFQAEWEVLSEAFCILASWFLSSMSKNSIFEELKSKKISIHPGSDQFHSVFKARNA